MDMIFCPLYSGSSGNALFVQYGATRLLIDAGKPGKTVASALELIGVEPASLDGVLITHEHSDHIAGAGVLCRRYRVPVYATEDTWRAMDGKVGEIPPGLRRTFDKRQDFYLGDIGVVPFAIPHDAADPVGYRLWGGQASAAGSVPGDGPVGDLDGRAHERLVPAQERGPVAAGGAGAVRRAGPV